MVASAGAVAVRFILQHTHGNRLIPIITSCMNHKSKEIRRASCEYLNLILKSWPQQLLVRHVNILQDSIKKGIADSDPEARSFARRYVFWLNGILIELYLSLLVFPQFLLGVQGSISRAGGGFVKQLGCHVQKVVDVVEQQWQYKQSECSGEDDERQSTGLEARFERRRFVSFISFINQNHSNLLNMHTKIVIFEVIRI